MILNFTEFSERFGVSKPYPVYIFSGEERFFIDEGVKVVKDKFLDAGLRDFNYDAYSAGDVDASNVINSAETLPVMAEKRVIVVKDADEWGAKDKEIIVGYLKNPSTSTCLILTASKLDKREKFFNSFDKSGVVILCQPLYKDGLKKWIIQQIRKGGKAIDKDAVDMLVEVSGNEMLSLNSDIDKLILYCNDRKNISVKDVGAVSGSMRSFTVFEVVNAIIDRRLKDAVISLHRAIDDGEPPVRIFYFILREFRMMLKAKTAISRGKSNEEAAKLAGVPPFKVKEFSQKVNKISRDDLFKLFDKLIDIDSRLKGSSLKPAMILEDLLLFIYCMKQV